jgi:hypothetical protein
MSDIAYQGEVSKFSTGAVRSSDAKNVRFDLISPYSYSRVAEYARESKDLVETMNTLDEVVMNAQGFLYIALGGEWDDYWLESAAIALLNAMHREETGQPYPYNDRPAYIGLRRLAETYKEGADKYNDHNWLKGMPVSDLLNHATRHLFIWLDGDRSEDHLAHATWGVFAAIHSLHYWPHLNKNLLGPNCTPPAAEPAPALVAAVASENTRNAAVAAILSPPYPRKYGKIGSDGVWYTVHSPGAHPTVGGGSLQSGRYETEAHMVGTGMYVLL